MYVRRRRMLAFGLAGTLAVVGFGLGGRMLLYDAGLADITDVRITGTAAVPVEQVADAAAVTVGAPLAAIDTEAIAARVEQQLIGVADAEVDRDWPHTVEITITERIPVAVADIPQGRYLVDGAGVPFRPAPDKPGLPQLAIGTVGPGDPATVTALAVLATLPADVREPLLTVEVSPPGQVTLRLTKGREVRWGSPDRATEKAQVLAALLSQSGSVYDVASPELPTIRR